VWLAIEPFREGWKRRFIALQLSCVSFLDGPNSTIGAHLVKSIACVREAATQFDTHSWIKQLEDLLMKASQFSTAINSDGDSSRSTDAIFQSCGAQVWAWVHERNETCIRTPQFSFLKDIAQLSVTPRDVYVRRRATRLLDPYAWLRANPTNESCIDVLTHSAGLLAFWQRKPGLMMKSGFGETPSLDKSQGWGKSLTVMPSQSTQLPGGYIVIEEGSALERFQSDEVRSSYADYIRKTETDFISKHCSHVGTKVLGISMAGMTAKTALDILTAICCLWRMFIALIDGHLCVSRGAGDDDTTFAIVDFPVRVVDEPTIHEVARQVRCIWEGLNMRAACGFILNYIKATLSVGIIGVSNFIAAILCERILSINLLTRQVSEMPALKLRPVVQGEFSTPLGVQDSTWSSPSGAYCSLNTLDGAAEDLIQGFLQLHHEAFEQFLEAGIPLWSHQDLGGIGLLGIPHSKTSVLRKLWTMSTTFEGQKDLKRIRALFATKGHSGSRDQLVRLRNALNHDVESRTFEYVRPIEHDEYFGQPHEAVIERIVSAFESKLIYWLAPVSGYSAAPKPSRVLEEYLRIIEPYAEATDEPDTFKSKLQRYKISDALATVLGFGSGTDKRQVERLLEVVRLVSSRAQSRAAPLVSSDPCSDEEGLEEFEKFQLMHRRIQARGDIVVVNRMKAKKASD
jgi:hypothetical protein